MKKGLKIYLFRHGQTTYNRDRRFTGWDDPPLTEKGVGHAKGIASKLKGKKFQVAVHSRLQRSKDTLREVLRFHPECERVIEDDRMIERNYGSFNGILHNDFVQEVGWSLLKFNSGDDFKKMSDGEKKEWVEFLGNLEYEIIHRGWDSPPPEGESFKMVEMRVREFISDLKKIMKKDKVNVAISAHGNSIRLFRKIMEGASIDEACSWSIPYDRVFEYRV